MVSNQHKFNKALINNLLVGLLLLLLLAPFAGLAPLMLIVGVAGLSLAFGSVLQALLTDTPSQEENKERNEESPNPSPPH
ncbi:MAG TPA: hypothetical protein DDZ80_28455 [Cyanobacteria bacterium UBA8803]|nr:hypothetical protein [Cyanobacteria bacterium UBA9273]HBL62191.1 hypothetical protein [Cyanobacteria bacterium UBA8803]